MNSNGGSSFFGSDWLGAFLIIAILFGGWGMGGNRGPMPNVATQEYVQSAINNQTLINGQRDILLSSANNNYETAKVIMDQTRDMMMQNNTNQINVIQGFNQIQQSLGQITAHMDECCCKIQTMILQSNYDEALRELQKYQNDKSNADQTAYLLSVMGKWVANPAAASA
jgi:hypothetical protein